MTTYTLSGNTFARRDRLKELGGVYDGNAKVWKFHDPNARRIAELKTFVGCMLTEEHPIAPLKWISADDEDEQDDETPAASVVDCRQTTHIVGDDETYFNAFQYINPKRYFGFSSVSALLEHLQNLPENKRRGLGWKTDDPKWHGTRNFDDAVDLVQNGWSEGVEIAETIMEEMTVETAVSRRRSHSLVGGKVNVGRMLSGNPLHMSRKLPKPGKRAITLFCAASSKSAVKAETMMIRTGLIAALVDMLEQHGYSVEVVATFMTSGFGPARAADLSQMACKVKSFGEKMNINDLVFSLGHPSFLRRFKFALIGSCDELQSIWTTQGYAADAFGKHLQPGKNEFYLKVTDKNPEGATLIDKAREIFRQVKPHGLDIEF